MVNPPKSKLSASSKAVDPALAALFAGSAKPVTVPPKSRYAESRAAQAARAARAAKKATHETDSEDGDEVDNDQELSALDSDEELDDEDQDAESVEDDQSEDDQGEKLEASSEDEPASAVQVLEAVVINGEGAQKKDRKRKRNNRDEDDDLEARYLQTLVDDDDEEPAEKRQKGAKEKDEVEPAQTEDDDDDDDDDAPSIGSESESEEPPKHESLDTEPSAAELEKANRTIFISNVCSSAITSRTAKRTLLSHLSSVLDKKASPPQTITSIRFRSTAFAAAGIPKRAAFIKKEVMTATTRSTNAYVVYSHPSAVRAAVNQLNGTVVLDRHIRVDSVAHPATVDHRRCVFVGNLGFVDDETVLHSKTDEEGKQVTETKKRTKTPMDVEEGLWKVFGEKAGKIESVRVPRDPATRVGKGFAYIQFCDGNAVESALLLSGKKFPPMLPRELRVSRCKAPHKTARAMEAKAAKSGFADDKKQQVRGGRPRKQAGDYVPKPTAELQTLAGRAGKLLGRSAGAKAAREARGKDKKKARSSSRPRRMSNGPGNGEEGGKKDFKSPEAIVFEGRRASAKDGKPKDLKFKGSKGKGGGQKKRRSAKEGRGGVRAAKWRADGGKK